MRTLISSLAVAAVLLVGGCSASSGSTTDQPAPVAGEAGSDAGSAGSAAGGDKAADGSTGVTAADPSHQFVVQGTVTLEVDDPAAAAEKAAGLVEGAGGHVQERVEQGGADGEPGSAHLVVRIPSTQVTGTLAALKDLGTIRSTSLTSTEVTAQAKDLDARIHALQVSVTRLEDLLSRAGSIADVVEAERVLTDRQSELESLQSQRATLADQVQMATITLELFTPANLPETKVKATGFWAGLVAGWESLLATLNGFLQLLGVLLPWLAFAALVTVLVVAISRALTRRRAAMGLPSASRPGPFATARHSQGPGPGGNAWPGAGPVPGASTPVTSPVPAAVAPPAAAPVPPAAATPVAPAAATPVAPAAAEPVPPAAAPPAGAPEEPDGPVQG
jgi:hypothetical protein